MTGQDLFNLLMPRIAKMGKTSGLSFVDALNIAIDVLFIRLMSRRSDIVQDHFSDISSINGAFSLPESFRGLANDPWLLPYTKVFTTFTDSETWLDDGYVENAPTEIASAAIILSQLPSGEERYLIGDTTQPKYYELIGKTIQLFPDDGKTRSLHGKYFSHPGKIELTDEIPWRGDVDAIISDTVLASIENGSLMSQLANQPFVVMIDTALGSLLDNRKNTGRKRARGYFY